MEVMFDSLITFAMMLICDSVTKRNMEIVIFSRPNCQYCVKAKALVSSLVGVNAFQIVLDDQEDYAKARAEMVSLSNGATTVPQIFVNGKHLPGGYTGLKHAIDHGKLADNGDSKIFFQTTLKKEAITNVEKNDDGRFLANPSTM